MSLELLLHQLRASDDWKEDAACRGMDTDLFYPELGDPTAEARKTCVHCPVQAQCRRAGMGEVYGVWGNTSPEERRRLRRQAGRKVTTYRLPPLNGLVEYLAADAAEA